MQIQRNQIDILRTSVSRSVNQRRYPVDAIDDTALQNLLTQVGCRKDQVNTRVDLIRSDLLTLTDLDNTAFPLTKTDVAQQVNGNKLFKLLPNLYYSLTHGISTITSFGGVWSNNIHALAMAARCFGLGTLGVIRGEHTAKETDCLADVRRSGMKTIFIPRRQYRVMSEGVVSAEVLTSLIGLEAKKHLVLPPGSANTLSVLGCSVYGETLARQLVDYDELWLACGTGSTFLGVISGLYTGLSAHGVNEVPRVVGVNVVANPELQRQQELLREQCRLHHIPLPEERALKKFASTVDGAAGGYARCSSTYHRFYSQVCKDISPPIDHVYVAKVLYALCQHIAINPLDSRRIAVLHTGGQQGMRGYRLIKSRNEPDQHVA